MQKEEFTYNDGPVVRTVTRLEEAVYDTGFDAVYESSGETIPGLSKTSNFNDHIKQFDNNHFSSSYKDSSRDSKDSSKSKNLISRFFSKLSRWGMDYDEDIIKNMKAMPADKSLIDKTTLLQNQDLFNPFKWNVKTNQEKNFFEKDLQQKRESLRNFALQPELEDILDTMSNECIVYDSNNTYFAEPYIDGNELKDFTEKTTEQINTVLAREFRRLYKMFNWRTNAWDDFKRFLIEGDMAWEIVYDSLNEPTKIIGVVPIDACTITKKYDNGKWYWIQYKGVMGKERKLLDSQVIYLSYQETRISSRQSYLERLIRPFNIYRIIEQAQIIWTVTNSQYKMKFTIPTTGMNKILAKQTLASAMQQYREDVNFVGETGELKINGKTNLPFNKEYWLASSDSGTPEIESIGGDGPELSDNDQLKYFRNQLYKISKIPLSRFDQESGETWFGTDASSVARTEIDFGRFVARLRNQFSQVILKPLRISLALNIKELEDNRAFLDAIQLHFKSYNLFEEMMEMELMNKRVEFIREMKEGLVDQDKEGNEVSYWSSEFLVKKYLHLSDDDTDLNNKLKKKEIEALNLAGSETEEEDDI